MRAAHEQRPTAPSEDVTRTRYRIRASAMLYLGRHASGIDRQASSVDQLWCRDESYIWHQHRDLRVDVSFMP